MTRSDHPSGTDRVAEAVCGMEADIVVNVQGDEPLVDPALIDRLAETLAEDASWDMATAASPIREPGQLANPAVVKVVWDRSHRALYFSRWAIPFVRDGDPASVPHWRHIGIYAYRRSFLDRMVAEPPCRLEMAEKLEQLRALDMGARIVVVETESFDAGVDTPADVQYVESALRRRGERV
jgi:3-deoxy-manno-octulosonate cytidylyltransferase (CMP-KDO synthetase)